MSLTFQCPSCQSTRRVSSSMEGRRLRCPDCDAMVRVPAAEESLESATGAAMAVSTDKTTEQKQIMEDAAPGRQGEQDSSGDYASYDAVAESDGDDGGGWEDDDWEDDDWEDDDWEDEDWDGGDGEGDDEVDEAALLGDRPKRPEGEMDMTPMVDVTFLLLIFFMVTAAFSLQKSIEIPKPEQTDEPSTNVQEIEEETPDIVTVQIDEYNTFTVLTPDWEREAPGEIDLLARLREAREGSDGIIPSQLLVKAHGECLHKRVVMALDAGSECGFESVQLMTVDGEF